MTALDDFATDILRMDALAVPLGTPQTKAAMGGTSRDTEAQRKKRPRFKQARIPFHVMLALAERATPEERNAVLAEVAAELRIPWPSPALDKGAVDMSGRPSKGAG